MPRFLRYTQILFLSCAIFTLVYSILVVLLRSLCINREELGHIFSWSRKKLFTEDEINRMSSVGKWLLSLEASLPAKPGREVSREHMYLILIWKHGLFLERRHIRRFTNQNFSPWDDCSVKNCRLSYKSKDLIRAAAVMFHLHLTKTVKELPAHRIRSDQRWIFLTDESPMHTFLYGNQNMSDYNGLFNWSMSYRMDSDVPVPYGRTTIVSSSAVNSVEEIERLLDRKKNKLVAIMGSNCAANNGRWHYVRELKLLLGDKLEVYGKCLNGNVTACPGHFERDCLALNAYKFYLAFENSNCKEYLTEKTFWNGYGKYAVPIIMGPSRKDCEKLLPPHSFLHVQDFSSPSALTKYIEYLDRNNQEYLRYHEWRIYYKVINEHGYYGSVSRHYCRICEALNYNFPNVKVYEDLSSFWNKEKDCTLRTNSNN